MRRHPYYPDLDYVKSLLRYDRSTGEFFWVADRSNVKAGTKAGCRQKSKNTLYLNIKIDRLLYKAHHLVWLFETGAWPIVQIDHIDLDGSNNRFENLRLATNSQNKANCSKRVRSSSLYKGVFWRKDRQRWVAQVYHNKKKHVAGSFKTEKEAGAAYIAKAHELFGDFARSA